MSMLGRRTLASLVVFASAVTLAQAAKQLPLKSFEGPPKFEPAKVALFESDLRTKIGPGLPGGVTPPASGGGGGNTASPGDDPGAGGGGGGGGGSLAWSKLITPENLEAEIKALQKPAGESTKTMNVFKGNGRVLAQNTFAELAVLFGVIAQYDGDVRWKKESLGLTKIYAQATNNCKTSSDAAYKGAQLCTQQLAELIRGTPPEMPKADAPNSWKDVTDRPSLMRRIEELRTGPNVPKWISGKNDFKKNKDALLREAQIMLMISEVIKDKNFESGDDDSYQKYAKAFSEQCVAFVEAIKSDNQDKAQGLMAGVSKSCDTCHGDFR